MATSALAIEDVQAGYGAVRVLDGVSLTVRAGEVVVLLGTNGNGKTTLMRCILGLIRPSHGSIRATIDGRDIDLLRLSPEEIVSLGIVLVPEGRRLFRDLTVEENLVLGAYRPAARAQAKASLRTCYDLFPKLEERRRQRVGSMSGGEQQMVALARALMAVPTLLLVDEPSVGLAPILVKQTIAKIGEMQRRLGLTVLMAEQNFTQGVRIADRGYVLVHGAIAFAGNSAEELHASDLVRQIYLGM